MIELTIQEGVVLNVSIRLFGVFRSAAKTEELRIDTGEKTATVRSVIQRLVSEQEYQNLKQLLFAGDSSDPRPNALIMVSGREISSLKGLETEVSESDQLSILPIAHGG